MHGFPMFSVSIVYVILLETIGYETGQNWSFPRLQMLAHINMASILVLDFLQVRISAVIPGNSKPCDVGWVTSEFLETLPWITAFRVWWFCIHSPFFKVPTELLKSQSEAAACRCYVRCTTLSSRTHQKLSHTDWHFSYSNDCSCHCSSWYSVSQQLQATGIPWHSQASQLQSGEDSSFAWRPNERRSTQRAPDVEVSETTVTFQWNSGDEPDEPWILWVSHMISVDFRFQWGFMTVVNKRSLCRFTGELTTVWCLLLLLSRLDQISSCKLTSMFKASCAEREPRKKSAMAATQFLTTTRSSILASTKSFQRLLNVTW